MPSSPPPTNAKRPRKKLTAWFKQTEIPLTVYASLFTTMALIWIFQDYLPELLAGLFTELLGAAFTLFIIPSLLYTPGSKTPHLTCGSTPRLNASRKTRPTTRASGARAWHSAPLRFSRS